jgi:sulfite exporter TauE/SafE
MSDAARQARPARAIEQRCTNHETREAVCRCPGCGRSFCRECVTEHEARLLCATCLGAAVQTAPKRQKTRRFKNVLLVATGVVLAWFTFFVAGESLTTITERMEQAPWHEQ